VQQVHACKVAANIFQQLYLLHYVENCSLYYLSVEICVATIRNLQPLDAEKLFVNMSVAPRKWCDCMWQPVSHMHECVTVLLATHVCAGLAPTCVCVPLACLTCNQYTRYIAFMYLCIPRVCLLYRYCRLACACIILYITTRVLIHQYTCVHTSICVCACTLFRVLLYIASRVCRRQRARKFQLINEWYCIKSYLHYKLLFSGLLFLTAFLKHSGNPYKRSGGVNVVLASLQVAVQNSLQFQPGLRPEWPITWPNASICFPIHLLNHHLAHLQPPPPTHIGARLI